MTSGRPLLILALVAAALIAAGGLAVFFLRPAPALAEKAAPPAPLEVARHSDTGIPSLDAQVDGMEATCASVQAAEPPPADKPTAAQTRALAGCHSTDLYYGVDGRRDLRKARLCAFVEWESADKTYSDTEPGPGGAGLLAMIYANGEGVRPNYPFATRMACAAGYSSMDKFMAIELVEKRKADPTANTVEICDAAGSGWFAGQCVADEARRNDLKRDARLAALQRGWPATHRQAWAMVIAGRTAFEEARVGNEIDLSATLRTAYAVDARTRIRDFDEALLKDLMGGRLSGGSAVARKADDDLNAIYRKLMDEPGDEFLWPPRAKIRAAQRAWLLYRDSWRRFAQTVRPGQADAVAARLTAERGEILTCMLEDPPESLDCDSY